MFNPVRAAGAAHLARRPGVAGGQRKARTMMSQILIYCLLRHHLLISQQSGDHFVLLCHNYFVWASAYRNSDGTDQSMYQVCHSVRTNCSTWKSGCRIFGNFDDIILSPRTMWQHFIKQQKIHGVQSPTRASWKQCLRVPLPPFVVQPSLDDKSREHDKILHPSQPCELCL
jgi:hypothetical protein